MVQYYSTVVGDGIVHTWFHGRWAFKKLNESPSCRWSHDILVDLVASLAWMVGSQEREATP